MTMNLPKLRNVERRVSGRTLENARSYNRTDQRMHENGDRGIIPRLSSEE